MYLANVRYVLAAEYIHVKDAKIQNAAPIVLVKEFSNMSALMKRVIRIITISNALPVAVALSVQNAEV